MTTARHPTGNRLQTAGFDERLAAPEAYVQLFAAHDEASLARAASETAAAMADAGVRFGSGPFLVDVVPRILTAAEWDRLAAGLAQRIRALNAFLGDVYGDRRAVAGGVVPERVIATAEWLEPAMEGVAAGVRAGFAGPDLVRAPDGELLVLEDNMRAPSGLAYLLEARRRLEPLAAAAGLRPRPLGPAVEALGAAIAAFAPADISAPRVVLLNDGPGSGAAFEHADLARRLGMTVAATADLRRRGDRLLLGDEPVDVLYRRVDDERLTGPDGSPTALGELLAGPLRSGALGCVNSPGSGIADDKAIHVYVEALVRFHLGEEPLLRSVPGWDLGDPAQLEQVEDRLDDLVLKPRSEFGGRGVTIGPLSGSDERAATLAAIRRDPGSWVAQELLPLSTHPTVTPDGLADRHVDLRPFVFSSADSVSVAPGGLTRFAPGEGEMIVNSGQGGGAKDTWVL